MGESTSPALLAAQRCPVDCPQRVFRQEGGVSTTPSERLKVALGDDIKHIRVSTKSGELQPIGSSAADSRSVSTWRPVSASRSAGYRNGSTSSRRGRRTRARLGGTRLGRRR